MFMANVRRTSVNPKPAPSVDMTKPCRKPEAAKGDDGLMSSECTAPVERRRLATEVVETSVVVEGTPDDSPDPPQARQDLAAVLERVSKSHPHLTYLPAD